VTRVPAGTAPSERARRLKAGVLIVVGSLLIAGFLVAWIVAYHSSDEIDPAHPYLWRSGSTIYLANPSGKTVHCTMTPGPAELHDFRVPGSYLPDVSGTRVNPSRAVPATVTCDGRVIVSWGPVLALYPVMGSSTAAVAGVVLLAAGLVLAWRLPLPWVGYRSLRSWARHTAARWRRQR
jgi:hypothetical protein